MRKEFCNFFTGANEFFFLMHIVAKSSKQALEKNLQ